MDKTKSHTRITKLDRTNKYLLFALLSLFGLTVLSGTIIMSNSVNADNDSVVDEINITVPVSCTLSGSGMTSHTASIPNGTYNSSIGETTMKAFCNDNNGFAIYAIGFTDNEDGKNVLTNTTLGSTYDIETGTAITGNDSQWAMKLSKVTSPTPTYPIIIAGSTDDTEKEQGDPDFTTFQEVPDDYALVAKRTAGTDIGINAEGATLKSTYQAYISKTQPAGIYTGQVKYTLVHPHNAAAPQTVVYMQDLTSASIATLLPNTHDTAIVYDKRDNQPYNIAKLADNNYWMLDNLSLDLTDINIQANLSSLTTNANDISLSYLKNGGGTSSDQYALSGVVEWSESPDYASDFSFSDPLIATMGFCQSLTNCVNDPEDWQWTKNSLISYGEGSNKIGIYYNYCAATAGSYCYGTSHQPTGTTDATEDICPRGWQMPTGGNSGEYEALIANYNNNSTIKNALHLSPTGHHDAGRTFQNDSGIWWSSTYYTYAGTGIMYSLAADTTSTFLGGSMASDGNSVRCIFKTN